MHSIVLSRGVPWLLKDPLALLDPLDLARSEFGKQQRRQKASGLA